MRPALSGLFAVLCVAGFQARGADATNATVEAATAALSVAQTAFAKAERDLNRQTNLKTSDSTTQAAVDNARANRDKALVARDAADADLRRALQAAAAR